jgi:hypothetical protein
MNTSTVNSQKYSEPYKLTASAKEFCMNNFRIFWEKLHNFQIYISIPPLFWPAQDKVIERGGSVIKKELVSMFTVAMPRDLRSYTVLPYFFCFLYSFAKSKKCTFESRNTLSKTNFKKQCSRKTNILRLLI